MKRYCLLTMIWIIWSGFSVEAPSAQEDVTSLQIKNDTTEWRMIIPFRGRWSNWAMNNPTRLVIDLIEGKSKLPKSPGLWVLDLFSGPVSRLRTSQYSSVPGKRRVRITLDLKDAYRYEAIKGTDEVEIVIQKPEEASWGDLWVVDVDRLGSYEKIVMSVEETPPLETEIVDDPELDDPGDEKIVVAETDIEEPPAESEETLPAVPDELLVRQPESRPLEGEEFSPAILESILGDSTLFDATNTPMQTSWDLAAARLVEEAQEAYLVGDTTATVEKLVSCERFYADTEPGRQATLLRHFVLREMGRVVEADLPPAIPSEGPWLMIYDSVMERMLNGALKSDDLALADDLLKAWQQADPDRDMWASGALRLAESHLDRKQTEEAGACVKLALEANPDLNASPRALMLYAMINVEAKSFETADEILDRVISASDEALVYRARAVKGDIRYRMGKFNQAITIYSKLVAEDAPRVEREWATYQLGNCYDAVGDHDEAIVYLDKVVEDPAGNYWAKLAQLKLVRMKERHHVADVR